MLHLIDCLAKVLLCEETLLYYSSAPDAVITNCFDIGEVRFMFLVVHMFGKVQVY